MEFLGTTVAEKLDEDGIAEYDGDGNEGQIGQVLMEAVQHGGLVGRTRLKWSVERSWGSYVERPGRSREANGAGICRTGGGGRYGLFRSDGGFGHSAEWRLGIMFPIRHCILAYRCKRE